MDVTWQGKLHEQQQHSLQHGLGSGGNPAAAAARSHLSGGAFDPSALQWGLGAAGLGLSAPPEAAAAAASQMLSALGPAQVLALLSNPLYLGECCPGCLCLCACACALLRKNLYHPLLVYKLGLACITAADDTIFLGHGRAHV